MTKLAVIISLTWFSLGAAILTTPTTLGRELLSHVDDVWTASTKAH